MNLTLKEYLHRIEAGESIKDIFNTYLEKAKNDKFNAYVRLNEFEADEENLKNTVLK